MPTITVVSLAASLVSPAVRSILQPAPVRHVAGPREALPGSHRQEGHEYHEAQPADEGHAENEDLAGEGPVGGRVPGQ